MAFSWSFRRRKGVIYASRLADNIELRKVELAAGHKSTAVAEVYAAHALDADFKAPGEATAGSFGSIVPLRKS